MKNDTTEPEETIVPDASVDVAPAPADPVDDAAPVAGDPTPQEAQAMFADNPGLAAVVTSEGVLHRDGLIVRVAIGE